MSNNPPQLQLSLGHQTFKRSFTQFGLDVDDAEDSRSDSGSASASSSSGSSSNASAGGSGMSTGLRSLSSGSSYSSPAADVFGYNDGERSERNKRARSEGPEREAVSVSSTESMDSASVLSLPASTGSVIDISASSTPSGASGQGFPQDATNLGSSYQPISNYETTSGFTLPMLDFGPSTPSVAEFVALRSSTSNTRPAENPPGFANMLSPRSSSPAPPPAVEIDVTMRDEDDEEDESGDPLSLYNTRLGHQNSTSSGVLDTARSDAFLNSATERLHSAMERARNFDRLLAPLRSDAADGVASVGRGSSTQQSFSRPRLPPFDFEARRRHSPFPLRTNSGTEVSHPFARNLQQSSEVATSGPGSSTSFSRDAQIGLRASTHGRPSRAPFRSAIYYVDDDAQDDSESEDEDDVIVDRELTIDPDLNDSQSPLTIDSSSSSSEGRPSLHNRATLSLSGDASRLDAASGSIEDVARDIERMTGEGRHEFDVTRILRSLAEPTSQLDSRLSVEESNVSGPRFGVGRPTRLQAAMSGSRAASQAQAREAPSSHTDSLTSALYGLVPPPHSDSSWNRERSIDQDDVPDPELTATRFRGWPWNDLLNSPTVEESSIPGLSSRANSETQAQTQTRTTQQESPRLQLRPHSPLFPFPLLTSNSRSDPASPEAGNESEMRRIERMVEMDRETNAQSRFVSTLNRPQTRGDESVSSRLNFLGREQRSPPASRPLPRPNLPTLRSAIFGPLRNESGERHETSEDGLQNFVDLIRRSEIEQATREAARASVTNATVSPSMSGSGRRSRGTHGDHGPTRPSLLDLQSQTRDRVMRRELELSASYIARRVEEEEVGLPQNNAARAVWEGRRLNRTSSGVPATNSAEQLPASHVRARDYAREASERRDLLQSWFPPIYEENRIRDAERTRLRELREQHRLSVPSAPSFWSRPDRTTQPQMQTQRDTSGLLRYIDSWNDARPDFLGIELRPSSNYPRTMTDLNDSTSNGVSTSTEAAAYFASGPSARQPSGRPLPAAHRQRPPQLLSAVLGYDYLEDAETNTDPPDTYAFGRDARGPSAPTLPPGRNFVNPTDDMLRILYASRGLQNNDAMSQRQSEHTSNSSPSVGRAVTNSESNDLPPLEESRVRTWNNSPLRRAQVVNSNGRPGRSISLRSSSRPPSLPPLHFDRLAAMTEEGSENAENRLFGSQEPSVHRAGPWRRPNARSDGHSESPGMISTAQNPLQRSSDLAMHRAMVLRSVQAGQAAMWDSERQRSSTTAATRPPPGRSQGFQHAMHVLGADGLSRSLRQQFGGAFEREHGQDRPRPSRNETHVRWGEITEDDPDAHSSAFSRAEMFRTRRRSTSALFAPPPENVDSLPPNRPRGTGTAVGDPSAQSQASQFDWFSMVSSSRARARNRARLARADDEPVSRSFFRLGRNRPGTRNLGDFMRDEDFDTSYESLIALAATLGDVKPRSTPAHVISALPTGLYKDWQSPGCDLRCPICLDDYKDIDPLLKAEPCNHWCHKECLEQWLHTASTCPVCRTKIRPSQHVTTPPPVAGPSRLNRNESLQDINIVDSDDESDDPLFGSSPRSVNRALFELLPHDRLPRSPPP